MTKERPGIAFQNLVASIEKAIAGQDGVALESPAYVLDSEGERREHDILITNKSGLRTTLTAVECKDKGRKIGLPDLEAFQAKCLRTGIHSGVVVSSSGFTESAMRAAPKMNLQCLELSRVDSFPWVGVSVFTQMQRDYSNIDVDILAATPIVAPFEVMGDHGEPLTMETYKNVMQAALRDMEPEVQRYGFDGPVSMQVKWKVPDAHVIDANGDRHKVALIVLRATWTMTETRQPFELHRYSGDAGEVEVASSRFEVPGLSAKLLMVRDSDSIRFVLEPDKRE